MVGKCKSPIKKTKCAKRAKWRAQEKEKQCAVILLIVNPVFNSSPSSSDWKFEGELSSFEIIKHSSFVVIEEHPPIVPSDINPIDLEIENQTLTNYKKYRIIFEFIQKLLSSSPKFCSYTKEI